MISESHLLDYTTDSIPRFSPNSGVNYRTVEWNSAKVRYVDSVIGNQTIYGPGTVFGSLSAAMLAITDSGYNNPYILKVRSGDGTVLAGATINKPYVWIQGDGATRVGQIFVTADGVRVRGLITTTIVVGDLLSYDVNDVDNVWITNNIITNDATANWCAIIVNVGGGNRTHGIMVSNNRLGGSNDPGAPQGSNSCRLLSITGDGGTGTVIQFVGNYVENSSCIHGYEALQANNMAGGSSAKVTTISTGNTYFCNIAPGIQETGENFSCVAVENSYGALYSEGDTCVMYRPDSGPYQHTYAVFQTDQTYNLPDPRSASFVNTTFLVNLPATRAASDSIGFAYVDSPYITLSVSNPRYHEIALGSGWTSASKYFVDVDAWRNPPPNNANTFLYWDNVSQAPSGAIWYANGAGAGNITAKPASRMLADGFDAGLLLTGSTLGGTCAVNELRYDIGGATKELWICDPVNTWNCAALGPKHD